MLDYEAASNMPPEDQGPPEDDADALKDLRSRLAALAGELETRADERVKRRINIENRWLVDLKQYHGVYASDELKKIREDNGSEIFENQTRAKTNAMAARLGDLLFPTDDKNWGIEPTPVPELVEGAEEILGVADSAAETTADAKRRLDEAAAANAPDEELDALSQEAVKAEETQTKAEKAADDLMAIQKEAHSRSKLMSAEIDDQLVTARYGGRARDAIMDACKIGPGILKGPIIGGRHRRRWKTDASGVHVLADTVDPKPGVERCDPWHTYLDPDVKDQNEGSGVFQRHFYNKRQMRKLAREPGMDLDAIRELLKTETKQGDTPHFMTVLADITGEGTTTMKDHFLVWEYSGPIDAEDMETLAEAFFDEADREDLEDEFDPLEEINARIWFCQGKVLKFTVYPLDSGDSLYSVFNVEEDEIGPYGFGIPYLMRTNQAMLNGAARMLMDNAGLGAGPQILVDKDAVKPANGVMEMRPRKVWYFDSRGMAPNSTPFQTFDIPTRQPEISAIIDLALRFMDDDTSIPKLAQGEQGAHITKTAQGMSILMNAANVVFKRVVKDWDDNITIPLITRFYDFNMQFSKKSAIKGDYDVKARGSSVLLVREMLSQNLIMIAQVFGDHPAYKEWIIHEELLKEIFRAHQIPAATIVKTAREIESDRAKKEKNPPPEVKAQLALAKAQDDANKLKQAELELKAELANLDAGTKRYVAQLDAETKKMGFETQGNMNTDRLNALLDEKAAVAEINADKESRKDASAERRLAAEIAMREQTGVSSGGAV